MSNNASPKPSEQQPSRWSAFNNSYRNLKRWQRWCLDIFLLMLAITLIGIWMSRHLLEKGTELPPLELTSLSGEPVLLDWPQETPRTLLYVFAPWCGICRISMPGLELIENQDLNRIAIALDYNSIAEVQKFVDDIGFSGQVLLGNAKVSRQLQIRGYPSYYVLNNGGTILHRDQGLTTPPGLWLKTRI